MTLTRKFISMLVVVLIALTALAPLSLAATSSSLVGEAAHVSTPSASGQVNLRSSAGMSGAVIATLPNTNPLVIVSKSGNWYKVCDVYTGKAGYMHKNYVAKTFIGTVSGSVNLRKGAGTNYGVIKVIAKDSEVTVIQLGKRFSKVSSRSTSGWISTKYLEYTVLGC
jgi:uncharacterized protein YgiM (DUF1202 family)